MPYLAVPVPADRVADAVVPPKDFAADGEGRRSENSEFSGAFGFSQQAIVCLGCVGECKNAGRILPDITQA